MINLRSWGFLFPSFPSLWSTGVYTRASVQTQNISRIFHLKFILGQLLYFHFHFYESQIENSQTAQLLAQHKKRGRADMIFRGYQKKQNGFEKKSRGKEENGN